VFFNNRFVPLAEARVGILTHALQCGTAVFDGIRGYWNPQQQELFLVRLLEHYQRWKANSAILHIGIEFRADALCEITADLARRNSFRTDVYVRPLAYKCAQRVGIAADDRDAFSIIMVPFGVYLDSSRGLHAGVVSWRRVEDTAIPARGKICGSYVNSVLASDEARRNGFDEAILLTEGGHVAEGASCNIFLVSKGRLITPAGTENILEGITRAAVIELARREMQMEVMERPVDRSELYLCDEVFFTGTAVEVGPVVQIDHRPVGTGQAGPVATELRRLYQAAARGQNPAYRSWLARVYRPAARHNEPRVWPKTRCGSGKRSSMERHGCCEAESKAKDS
jgi:branched-chain amino acid aminotransferase